MTQDITIAINPDFNGNDFSFKNNTCQSPLAAGAQCTVDALFVPQASSGTGKKLGELVVKQLTNPAAGEAVATLTGNAV